MPISSKPTAAEINVELGRAPNAPFSIGGAEERALAGVPSGPISMSDFIGKSAEIVLYDGDFYPFGFGIGAGQGNEYRSPSVGGSGLAVPAPVSWTSEVDGATVEITRLWDKDSGSNPWAVELYYQRNGAFMNTADMRNEFTRMEFTGPGLTGTVIVTPSDLANYTTDQPGEGRGGYFDDGLRFSGSLDNTVKYDLKVVK